MDPPGRGRRLRAESFRPAGRPVLEDIPAMAAGCPRTDGLARKGAALGSLVALLGALEFATPRRLVGLVAHAVLG
jgi:hypothetical protein